MKALRWEIEDFFTEDECKTVIKAAEKIGFDKASINTPVGIQMRMDYRNNDRTYITSQELADDIWSRLKDDLRLSNIIDGWKPIGLNERFRVYRYHGEQWFALHADGSYERVPLEEQSWVTLLIYLNDDFVGGETTFQDGEIVPKTGLAALMTQHNYLHEAREVRDGGTKYVLRTDVMYRKDDGLTLSEV